MSRHHPRNRITNTVLTCIALCAMVLSMVALGTGAANPSPARAFSPNGLVINEIYPSQASTPQNEYFELYNGGTAPIDLSTYVIYNRDGQTPLSRLDNRTILAGQFRAIGPTQLHTTTIAGSGLDRTDFLGLVDRGTSDTIIDVVNFGNPASPSWPNYEKFSQYFFTSNVPPLPADDGPKALQRWPDGKDTDSGTDFSSTIDRSPDHPSCGDPYEDDSTLGSAKEQLPGTEVLHRLCGANDSDFISINMSTSYTYTLQTLNPGSAVDTVLQLYDPSNVLIVTDDNASSRTSTIVFRPTANGLYKARVTHKTGAGNEGPNYLYTFRIDATSANTTATPVTPTPAGCLDPFEPDNSLQQARGIELNTEQVHVLCIAGSPVDQDWVAFSATSNKLYSMYTKDLASSVDTIISLYDSGGRKLAENDDAVPGQGLASRIDYTFGSTSVYYLQIRDRRGVDGTGYQYTVGLSSTGALPPTITASPSPTFNPNSPTPTPSPCNDSFEPDGVPQEAELFLIGSSQSHIICPATDADWVRFYARAGKVYTIRTTNLGIGLDTYMFLFDSNASSILAENDDGGDGSVASRIDFYPLRDDYYYVQVKNAGDIGGPQQTYDLSLSVVSGAPQPPSTATATGGGPPQPPAAVTPSVGAASPQPTRPPVLTPTQGPIEPTPASVGDVPPPVETKEAEPPEPTKEVLPGPTEPPDTGAGEAGGGEEEEVGPTATTMVVGVPRTGGQEDSQSGAGSQGGSQSVPKPVPAEDKQAPAVEKPPAAPAPPQFVSLDFRIFYDRNRNDIYEINEGIRGINVFFVATESAQVTGSAITSDKGIGSLKLPASEHRVQIPYLGIDLKMSKFPARGIASLWLPPVQLPDRVP
ncbi:MAG TPA: pre-peptidase C-terminal domain-containing protein [Chloroflexia bacterium]|nr:pre-peptidase C-terminal domain-containing protein [Chloroflexia bacterium]